MAVVATAERGLIVYQLENQPSEFRRIDSPLKHQVSFHPLSCYFGGSPALLNDPSVGVSVTLTARLLRLPSCPGLAAPLRCHI